MNEYVLERFYQYVDGVWQRRWLVVALALAICLTGWTVVAILPNTYTATGKIYVDTRGVLGPLLSGLAVDPGLDEEARVMQQTLLSRPNLEKLARETDRDIEATTAIKREELIDELRRSTNVSATQSNIFEIQFKDTEPQRAKASVQALIDIFVESNLGEKRQEMDLAHRFIDQQIEYYERKLEEAEQRLADYKQSNIGLLPGPGGYLTRAETATASLLEAQSALEEATTTRDVLREQLLSINPTIAFGADASFGLGPPSNTVVQLAELETHLGNLLRVYTDQHPQVVDVKQRIKELEKEQQAEMASLQASFGNNQAPGIGIPNPTFSQIELRLAEQEALIAVLSERVARQQESVDMLEQKALAVPVIEAEFSKLNRDYDVLKSNYEELLARRESAKISGDREASGQKAQFRIVEPPVTPSAPSGPNRPLLLSAVLVLGVGAAVAVALGLSLLNSAYYTARQLRDDIDLPFLGAISEIGNYRKSLAKSVDYSLFAVCGVLVFCLYGGTMLVERQVGLGRLSEVVLETRSIKPAVGLISENFSLSSDRNVGISEETGTDGVGSQ